MFAIGPTSRGTPSKRLVSAGLSDTDLRFCAAVVLLTVERIDGGRL